jgi:hypothetical protein
MAKFYVGQRVRIVRTVNYPEVLGREAVITGLYKDAWDGRKLYDGYSLDFQVQGIPYLPPVNYVARQEDIEPMIDPGREVISWEDMADLWTPEKLEA